MRRTLCIAGLLGACLGTPVAAVHAQGTIAPPGASGVDEYLETVPTDRGNTPAGGRAHGHALTSRQTAARGSRMTPSYWNACLRRACCHVSQSASKSSKRTFTA